MDVPKTFIHSNIPTNKYVEEMVLMKITVKLVDMLVKLDSKNYRKHVVFEN